MTDHEPTARSIALSYVIEEAIEEADEQRESTSYRWSTGIDRSDVESRAVRDGFSVSERTIDRALKDAAALGWVDSKIQGWDPGAKAEDYHAAVDLPGDPV